MEYPLVYLMRSKATGRGYVGSTTNLRRRKMDHKARLDRQCHWNPSVQRDFDQNGWRNFTFLILEAVFDGRLIEAENKWITALGDDAYNCRPAAVRSPETGEKIAAALKGKKHSAERRAANSRAHIGNQSAKGAVRSEEYKDAKARAVIVTDPEGNATEYKRVTLAAEAIGYERANMTRVLRNGGLVKRGPMRGWRFAYAP